MKQRKSSTKNLASNHAGKSDQTRSPEIDRFMGNFGSMILLVGLPLFVQFLWYGCHSNNCNELATLRELWNQLPDWKGLLGLLFPLPSTFSVGICLFWFLFQFVLHVAIPGKKHLMQANGEHLAYKVNGLSCYCITLLCFFASVYFGYFDVNLVKRIVFEEYGRILVTFQIFSFSMALLLYLKGYLFRQGNPCGQFLIDFFYGYEKNPRFFGIITTDVKWFMEGRALILWTLTSFVLAYAQMSTLGYVSRPMGLVLFFHFVYVLHYFIVETGALSMLDFTADHMGWMLMWGNGTFVPFLYTMPEWFLIRHHHSLSPWLFLVILLLYTLGYLLFRSANLQRRRFRDGSLKELWDAPVRVLYDPKQPEHVLLMSGWWGYVRKANYTGDLIQALCFGLPCLSFSLTPLVNSVTLTAILVQRERRDHHWCQLKYGNLWDSYCRLVPYRFIPGLY